MDIFTLIFGGLLGIAMLYLVMRLSYIIYVNVITGIKFRSALARKLHKLRLNRMLTALGIDLNIYLHHEQIVDIENQMSKCSACENTETCDDQLASGLVNTDNIDYCKNEEALKEIVDNSRIVEAAQK